MVQYIPMTHESSPELPSYRVTLFFGPESVEGESGAQACVFNVKKRSWKAGVQVSVEIGQEQLARLSHKVRLADRLGEVTMTLAPEECLVHQVRAGDLFVQAVTWCKLDLCLRAGLTQENQRVPAADFVPELDQSVLARAEYVVAYVLTELDLMPDHPSPSSH
jgi:hypothetical protein